MLSDPQKKARASRNRVCLLEYVSIGCPSPHPGKDPVTSLAGRHELPHVDFHPPVTEVLLCVGGHGQTIYDSAGEAGLRGEVPTGPGGSTFHYQPGNAADIFEAVRLRMPRWVGHC